MQRFFFSFSVLVFVMTLAGCTRQPPQPPQPPNPKPEQVVQAQRAQQNIAHASEERASKKTAGSVGDSAHKQQAAAQAAQAEPGGGHDCNDGNKLSARGQVAMNQALSKPPEKPGKGGPEVDMTLGKPLRKLQEVSIAKLFANPKGYEGKAVRVTGEIKDMCFHMRAWMGLIEKGEDRALRVFTAPNFRVPSMSVGRKVVAEGVIELVTLKKNQIEHFKQERHKFLSDKEFKAQSVQRPMLRAFGAQFFGRDS